MQKFIACVGACAVGIFGSFGQSLGAEEFASDLAEVYAFHADGDQPLATALAADQIALIAGEDLLEGDLDDAAGDDFLDLDITQLRNTAVVAPAFEEVVTSVSRQESTVGRSPAAVYVITQEMIRRSGARNVPEALRLAPGVHVAKVDGNKWSIGIRGFQNQFSSKLLVQIDGRSVYNNAFAGVYWDTQDVLLDDIQRIEVVRGPGATVWGSNAVNGVINVITKGARATQGLYAIAGGGTEEEGFVGARVGGAAAGGDLHWRVSGKWFERDTQFFPGIETFDATQQGRGAFRVDWSPNAGDDLTLQGDIYRGVSGSTVVGAPPFGIDTQVQGANLLGRWTRNLDADQSFSFQWYLDQALRRNAFTSLRWDVLDLDFQHRNRVGQWHKLIWGMRYRHTEDELRALAPGANSWDPESRFVDMYSGFVQDEMTLVEDELFFTIGTKLEKNQFTGWEWQPSARLLKVLDDRRVLWAGVSRAVRTPNMTELYGAVDFTALVGGPHTLSGNLAIDAEDLMAYEIGYRAQPADYFSWDAAFYYYEYDKVVDLTFLSATDSIFTNNANGEQYGIELSSVLGLTDTWRLTSHYTLGRYVANHTNLGRGFFGNPRHQAYLRSSIDLTQTIDCDLTARYVDNIDGAVVSVPHYLTLDARLGWHPNDQLELAVVGQNLLDSDQIEQVEPAFGLVSTRVQRGVYGSITWRY
jgi:iron complex outermembrane receptor protein